MISLTELLVVESVLGVVHAVAVREVGAQRNVGLLDSSQLG